MKSLNRWTFLATLIFITSPDSEGKIKTGVDSLFTLKLISGCVKRPWLVQLTHRKRPEAGFEKIAPRILSLLEKKKYISLFTNLISLLL